MNEHVHPVMAGILNRFAALPQQAQQAANEAVRRAVACHVTVTAADMHETFSGLFPSTADAALAGIERAGTPVCGVSVRPL